MLHGDHFTAFGMKGTYEFKKAYETLRYVVANFNGLVAKVAADTLFGEPVTIKSEQNKDWLADLWHTNRLQTQCFESAISNSALGDSIFRVRTENEEIRFEDVHPSLYFPHVDRLNPRKKPTVEELAWVVVFGKDKRYLIREIHGHGWIETRVLKLKPREGMITTQEEIEREILVAEFNRETDSNLVPYVETGIDDHNLLFHIPNYRLVGSREYFGTSDFLDTETLQFALNNRLTKIDNVLDQHSDPILAVPPGVLDENGRVKRESFNMFEIRPDEADGLKPEYIVWNANLDAAFKEIDKLVEFLFMASEVSPEVLGLGEGQAESGRALKMRMLRTLAKRNRKRLYYDQALTEMLEIAQRLSLNGYKVNGERVSVLETPTLIWTDGVIDDPVETSELAISQVDAGVKSKLTAIQEINGYTEEEAQAELERINEDQADFEATITKTTPQPQAQPEPAAAR